MRHKQDLNDPTIRPDKFGWKEGDLISSKDIPAELWSKLPNETKLHLESIGYVNGKAPNL